MNQRIFQQLARRSLALRSTSIQANVQRHLSSIMGEDSMSSSTARIDVTHVKTSDSTPSSETLPPLASKDAALLDVEEEEDDEMEKEEMFVDSHSSFEIQGKEWGGPRRGGRLPEPTRFGDWERKGRCSDF